MNSGFKKALNDSGMSMYSLANNKGRYSCDDGNVQELGINRRIRT